jgi:hypothetical protein
MTTRTVTGTVLEADLTAFPDSPLTFRLMDVLVSGGVTYPRIAIEVIPDPISGYFSVDLAVPSTGTAHYRITLLDGYIQDIYLDAGPATDLQTLLTMPVSPVTPSALQTIIDASNIATITNVSNTYIVDPGDEVIRCDGTFTVTLPPATGSGVAYCIKNIGTGVITIDGNGSETIDGVTTKTLLSYDRIVVLDAAAGAWDLVGGDVV